MDASWLLFTIASLLLIATPGQDMVLVMSRSIAQGPAAGVATAAGVCVGLLGHTALVMLGLGALLQASEWLFVALKLVGAAYLVWLGIGLLRSRSLDMPEGGQQPRPLARLFADGALSNLTNPKIAIFYFAFLPQFVDVSAAHPTLTVGALGVWFAVLGFIVKGPAALAAGLLSAWLRARPFVLSALYRTSGLVLIALGVRLALERRDA